MALLCLNFTLITQNNILDQIVSFHYQNAEIEQILKNIHQEYGVNFSYLNNEIPDDLSLTIHIENQPLYVALDEILKDTDLSYQLVSGQIVLKKDANKAIKAEPEKEQSQQTAPAPPPATDSPGKASKTPESVKKESKEDEQPTVSETTDEITEEPTVTAEPVREKVEPIEPVTNQAETNEQPEEEATVSRASGISLSEKIKQGLDELLFHHLPEESDYETRPFHFGLIYPISTNGVSAGKYVNEISLHFLVGYAAGLEGFEASGFGNLENDFVHGAQFAGFFNLVKNEVDGVQGAGFLNINGGRLDGAQMAGFLNISGENVEGAQMAGFLNVSGGNVHGAQFAGFMNTAAGKLDGVQGAGFLNIATDSVDGGQMAGFANVAENVNGIQLAGFANVTSGDVEGFQGSGFINIARNVKGVQLSVFNVADSVDGVPIGFLSIVRKNGYRALEVWGSESLHANVGFKIGVERFYNIFAVGTQFTDATFRWGLGYGIGTQFPSSSTFHMNLDLISYNIFEEDNRLFDNEELNLLNVVRIGFSKQFSEHFGLFVAPTFNVMVSQLTNTENNSIGSDLAPWTVYDRTFTKQSPHLGNDFPNKRTNVKMWPGFQVGLRF